MEQARKQFALREVTRRAEQDDDVVIGQHVSYLSVSRSVDGRRAGKATGRGKAAVDYVEDGMLVGLGTGTTVADLLTALVARNAKIRCVSTSPRTEDAARSLGIPVEPFDSFDHLDLTIDGADQIPMPDGWLVKGGGAADTREKIVAAAVDRFVVIADSTKVVDVRYRCEFPLELLEFGLPATLRKLDPVTLRDVPRSPDGGVIADYGGAVGDPGSLAARLSATPGVIDHGLFAPELVSVILIAWGDDVEYV